MTQGPTDPATPSRAGSRSFAGKWWFWVPILPLVILDLWSKSAVFAFMAENYGANEFRAAHPIWGGPVSFDLVTYYNTGTVWGIFQDYNAVLVVLRFFAIGFLLWLAWNAPRRARFHQLVLAMLMAGAIGNLYDNMTVEVEGLPQLNGGVRDFLLFTFDLPSWIAKEPWAFPAFNVADSCITVGAISLVILRWREEPPGARSEPAQASGDASAAEGGHRVGKG